MKGAKDIFDIFERDENYRYIMKRLLEAPTAGSSMDAPSTTARMVRTWDRMQDSKRDDLLAQAEQYQTVLNNL
jgi:hypothetical protein